jgi:hypothetical protein
MTKRLFTSAALVALLAITVQPVSANEVVRGRTFAVALANLPADLFPGDPLNVTVRVLIYDDGTEGRKPVTITLWTETPLGRAVLATETRSLHPGRTFKTGAAFNYRSPFPTNTFDPIPATVGVTVTYKTETLEARHEMLLHSGPTSE